LLSREKINFSGKKNYCFKHKMGEIKKLSAAEIHGELDLIALRLLNLSQELIHAKLRLEDLTKQARI
jgi:hypothetical protein